MKEERYDKIIKILSENGYASSAKLASLLYVSLPTLRRDLSQMEKKGLIVRCHGGARLEEGNNVFVPTAFREHYNSSEKRKISKLASTLVTEGSTVFIDNSTTTRFIVPNIKGIPRITVVTPSIAVINDCVRYNVNCIATGGNVNGESMDFYGYLNHEIIKMLNFDISFFSSCGIDENGNINDINISSIDQIKTVMKKSRQNVYLVDSDKVGVRTIYSASIADKLDCIITNKPLPENFNTGRARILICD